MNRLRLFIYVFALAAMLLGCQKDEPKADVVLWTAFEGLELQTLRNRIEDFTKESGYQVALLKVPHNSLQRKVLIAGPALQGPDILIAPHDWIGLLETAGLLAPIPSDIIAPEDPEFYPISLRAVSYGGQYFSAPMMMDCVVLARNTELCSQTPQDLSDLIRLAKDCQEQHPGTLGFAYELDNLYFSWGFLAGFGADFFAPFAQKDFDVDAVSFDSPEAIAGSEWVASLRLEHKLVPPGLENQGAVDLFLNKKLAMMLCGPWNLGDIRKAGVPYVLEPLPRGPKSESSPFVGVMGAMLNKYSADEEPAKQLLKYLSSAETGAQLCQSSGRAPARKDSSELLKERVTDPVTKRDLNLFSEAAQKGTPMPNHPAVSAVWEPMKQALELITTGQSQAQEELARSTTRVRTKIRFMME